MEDGKEKAKTLEFRQKLLDGIEDLLLRVEKTSCEAIEKVLYERMDTYFAQESRLEELEQMLAQIRREIDGTQNLSQLKRISARLNFIEDHLEDIDSVLYDRPMRLSKHRFRLFDFFKQWQENASRLVNAEFTNLIDAYREFGLDDGSSLKLVKKTFRKMIKQLHPDQNNGDRSHEPRMRRLLAAYEFIVKNR